MLQYYNQELQFIKEMGGEFAAENPKIAARLGMSGIECADPYVERLIESFAFLAARVQLRIDSEFPRFTQNMLQIVYPDYLCPVPSAAIVHIAPNLGDAGLAKGLAIPRGSSLTAHRSVDAATACEYRTAHTTTLWPLQITQATYRAYSGDLPAGLGLQTAPQAVLRIQLRATAGLKINQIAARSLVFFLCGTDHVANRIYESMLGAALGFFAAEPGQRRMLGAFQPAGRLAPVGFADDEALLPPSTRTFQGNRLLQEYFLFPSRFMFVEVGGIEAGFAAAAGNEIELVIPLARHDPVLEGSLSASDFEFHCTPAINLFPKRADRIHLANAHEQHLVVDRTRPMDFEVYRVREVTGYGEGIDAQREFLPFYAVYDERADLDDNAYFTVRREPRQLSDRQRRVGPRTNYVGSEVFLSLVDGREAPYPEELRQLGVETLCSNRDLPLRMALGSARGDFTLDISGPIDAVRCRKGPTPPLPAHSPGESTWRLVGLLAQNYLSLLDTSPSQGAEALRELLGLCAVHTDGQVRKQVAALRAAACRQVVRRLPTRGPVSFGRGIEVSLEIDESSIGGSGAFVMASVLRHFLSRHVSINGFVETVLNVVGRGEVMRWPAKIGARPII